MELLSTGRCETGLYGINVIIAHLHTYGEDRCTNVGIWIPMIRNSLSGRSEIGCIFMIGLFGESEGCTQP